MKKILLGLCLSIPLLATNIKIGDIIAINPEGKSQEKLIVDNDGLVKIPGFGLLMVASEDSSTVSNTISRFMESLYHVPVSVTVKSSGSPAVEERVKVKFIYAEEIKEPVNTVQLITKPKLTSYSNVPTQVIEEIIEPEPTQVIEEIIEPEPTQVIEEIIEPEPWTEPSLNQSASTNSVWNTFR
jgi:hypothetical protein